MARSVKGDQAMDDAFISGLRDLDARYHRNLSIDTYNLAIRFLEEMRNSGPAMKGLKAAWTKESQGLGYSLSEAQEVSDRMEQAYMEGLHA